MSLLPDEAEGSEKFKTKDELQQVAEAWPADRMAEIWNGIPGVTPVKKLPTGKRRSPESGRQFRAWAVPGNRWPTWRPTEPPFARRPSASRRARRAKGRARRPSPRGSRSPRRESAKAANCQGFGALAAIERCHAQGTEEGNRMAGAFGPRIHQRGAREEIGTLGRVHQTRGWRPALQDPPLVRIPKVQGHVATRLAHRHTRDSGE